MITYLKGDASNPPTERGQGKRNYIAHVCNNIGGWGSGFVLSLNKHSQIPKTKFLQFSAQYEQSKLLGTVHFAEYINRIKVINMIAQDGVRGWYNPTPIKYDALEKCMQYVVETVSEKSIIHAPKFGAGLAGGKWDIIESMIDDIWSNLDVRIYTL